MMQPAVRIENLSKLYRIGAREQAHYRTLRESLMNAAAGPWRRWQTLRNQSRVAAHELNGHARDCRSAAKSAEQNGTVPFTGSTNGQVATNGRAGNRPNFAQPPVQDENPVQNGTVPFGRTPSAPPDAIWALNDVSFDVQHGEVVGIIGRNGAGKSTLLKILSRITEPTHGRVVLNGRVASLLEVGTGFHPELTGRENIYLNGAILGMHRHEIKRKFDAIVDFSGIDQFLDTPVKRYSSGMYVRLAFAVAAHLDPEILIVDEVLAVGDAEFQRKCLGKMRDVAKSGRTVLFVSHNMAAVTQLCSTAVGLVAGKVQFTGSAQDVVTKYLSASKADQQLASRARDNSAVIRRIAIESLDPTSGGAICCGSDVCIRLDYQSPVSLQNVRIGFRIDTLTGAPLMHLQSEIATGSLLDLSCAGVVSCTVRRLPLLPGSYCLVAVLYSNGIAIDSMNSALEFMVEHGDYFGTGRLPSNSLCALLVDSNWSVDNRSASPLPLT